MSSGKSKAAGCGSAVMMGAGVVVALFMFVFNMKVEDMELPRLPPQITLPDDPSPPADGPQVDGLPDIPVSKRGNLIFESFSSSKRELFELHRAAKHEQTFYCGCAYKGKKPDHKSCGYKIRRDGTRAGRIEWEHVVPASRFGRTFKAWDPGDASCGGRGRGRDCAEEKSSAYRYMQADLYNLQPAIGEVNGDRSNYPMAILSGEAREYGACDVEIRDQKIEPAERIRGDIARTYLYMDWAYPGRMNLTRGEREQLLSWHRADPPDAWERERARRIHALQKNINPFVGK